MSSPTLPSELPGRNEPTARLGPPVGHLDEAFLEGLRATGAVITTDLAALAEHGRDWWPLSVGWAARDQVSALPSVVARPTTTTQVADVVRCCGAAGVAVTPSAGRSGVSGGAVPVTGGLVLDLTGLERVLAVDEDSLTVTVEAGVFGPELEAALRSTGTGYTLGHWPQSFDLSTVGGWLACRGAGQYSTRYGKIEDMVRGLRVVLADGSEVTTGGVGPRAALGPDLTQLFVGAEGTLGVITEGRFRVHPVPEGSGRRAPRPGNGPG